MIVLGADVGGTSCRVALFDGEAERFRVEGPGGAMRAGQGAEFAGRLGGLAKQLLRRAGLTRADVIVVGAAGAGGDRERSELHSAVEGLHLAWRTLVTTDAELARAAAFGDGPGILLIAGTGSIALGRDASGVTRRVGGLGWRMGDQGSGHWIGQRALAAVGAMQDGLGPTTLLTEALCAAAGAAGIGGLVRWSTTATTAAVAALAPAVLATAERGDSVALQIRSDAVSALTRLAHSAAPGKTPVALAGSLIAPGGMLRAAVVAACEAASVPVHPEAIDACRGAIALAEAVS